VAIALAALYVWLWRRIPRGVFEFQYRLPDDGFLPEQLASHALRAAFLAPASTARNRSASTVSLFARRAPSRSSSTTK